MIERVKRLFKLKREKEAEEVKLTLNDLPPCDFLSLSENEREKILLADGNFKYLEVFSAEVPKELYTTKDKRFLKSSLPIIKEPINLDELPFKKVKKLQMRESILTDMFSFFEKSLSSVIELEKKNLDILFRGYLFKYEEKLKRLAGQCFMIDLFKTLEYQRIQNFEPLDKLPKGVEETNVLSKLWMYEGYFKEQMFLDQGELILRFLYCKESLKVDNIHCYHHLLEQLVRFCSRRDFMISLNEKYGFEKNHPYTFINSNGLVFENHKNLFSNEVDFNWMRDRLISEEKPLTLKFCSRLAYVLRNENILNEKTTYASICSFFNKNFNATFDKIRPDEAQDSKIGKKEVALLNQELSEYRTMHN